MGKNVPLVCNLDFPDEWPLFSSICLARDRKKCGKLAYMCSTRFIFSYCWMSKWNADLPQKLDDQQNMASRKKFFYVRDEKSQWAACLYRNRNQFGMALKATRFRFWRVLLFCCFRITCLLLNCKTEFMIVCSFTTVRKMIKVTTT